MIKNHQYLKVSKGKNWLFGGVLLVFWYSFHSLFVVSKYGLLKTMKRRANNSISKTTKRRRKKLTANE